MARPAARPRPPGDVHRRHRAQRSKTTGRSPVTSPAPLHPAMGVSCNGERDDPDDCGLATGP